jgi:hypothetical protein
LFWENNLFFRHALKVSLLQNATKIRYDTL